MTLDRVPRTHRLGTAATVLFAALVLGASSAHAANRSWNSAVTGSAGTAGNWTPAIVPTYLDDALLYANGTYTISWASPQDTLFGLYCYGTPTLSISGTLGVKGTFKVVQGELGLGTGTLRANQVLVGAAGAEGHLNVTGGLATNGKVVSASTSTPAIFADAGSFSSTNIARVNLTGGGTLLSNSQIQTSATSFTSCYLSVDGYRYLLGSYYRSTLGTFTNSGGGGRGDVIFGAGGGNLSHTYADITNGAVLDVKGSLYAGRSGDCRLRLYETIASTNPRIYVLGNTLVGVDPTSAHDASGTLIISAGTALLGGNLQIGDPDYTGGSHGDGTVLIQGGKTVVGGAIQMPASLAGSLQLAGGTLRVLSGISEIRQDPAFNLSSGDGTPSFIVNGSATVRPYPTAPDPIALGVGRGGAGVLRISGPNARVELQGEMAIADSVGGTGIVEVDSSGVLGGSSMIQIGEGGQLSILNGASVSSFTAPIVSGGTITMSDGYLLGGGSTLTATSLLTGNGLMHGSWDNSGSIVIPSGTLYFDNDFHNIGGTISGGGILSVAGALYASGVVDVSVVAGGHLYPHDYDVPAPPQASNGLASARTAAVSAARRTAATGTTAAPLGHLHITGDLTLSSFGSTSIRVGSSASGMRDTIDVDGTASLDGTLELVSIAGDEPAPGDTITVLSAGVVNGVFSGVTLDGMDPGGDVQVLYSATDVKVVFTQSVGVEGPGPSTGVTELRFAARRGPGGPAFVLELPSAARVRVTVYDVSGRVVARLADDTYLGAGRFEFPMPHVASGMYFARARIESGSGRTEKTARVAMLR